MEKLLAQLQNAAVRAERSVSLARYSSFRIGGDADLAVFPRSREELLTALTLLRASGLPMLVIGKGSNVVFSDDGFRGVVLFTSEFRSIRIDGNLLEADAGATLAAVANEARRASLTGLEFAHGIPGTLGGAVFMNAGAYGGCMADVCAASEYFDLESGAVGVLSGEAQAFDVRQSAYQHYPLRVILGARLSLEHGEETAILEKMTEFSERRRSTQPLEYPSAGSVFKRPAGHFAGKLIEDCGLKGTAIGGAEVSVKHAGFIVNRGGATAEDVRRLVELIRQTVLRETGVELECEIRFL